MKTLIVPDIHNKVWVFDKLQTVIKNHNIDKLVFVGDYFDDWVTTPKDYRDTCEKLLEFKNTYDCTFLLGNHDAPYLTGEYQHYTTSYPDVRYDVRTTLIALEPQIVTKVDGYLISHAGVKNRIKSEWFESCVDKIQMVKSLDSNGWSPLWIRPNELGRSKQPQIVGHTPVVDVVNRHNVWYVDTLSTYSNGEPIGNYSVLIIENNKVEKTYL